MIYFGIFLTLFFNIFYCSFSLADSNVRGQIVLKGSIYYFKYEGTKTNHLIIATNDEVKKNLKCLKDGDIILGDATLINGTQLALKSIDYVGLKKLISNWHNEDEVFNFSDFKTIYYWQFKKGINRFRGPFPFHYILSPNNNSPNSCSWKMFITNETDVVFALLKWTAADQIRIDFYDSNNGEVVMTKHLIQSYF